MALKLDELEVPFELANAERYKNVLNDNVLVKLLCTFGDMKLSDHTVLISSLGG